MAACGTWSGYTIGCRCGECRKAARDYQYKLRVKLCSEIAGDEAWHGTVGGYTNHKCRCDTCRNAMRQYKIGWTEQNRDKVNESARDRYAADIESSRRAGSHYAAIRRARLASAPTVPFTKGQLQQRWDYFGNRCYLCGGEATSTDHVKPISKGGSHMLANLRPACGSCNSRKRSKWQPLGREQSVVG